MWEWLLAHVSLAQLEKVKVKPQKLAVAQQELMEPVGVVAQVMELILLQEQQQLPRQQQALVLSISGLRPLLASERVSLLQQLSWQPVLSLLFSLNPRAQLWNTSQDHPLSHSSSGRP